MKNQIPLMFLLLQFQKLRKEGDKYSRIFFTNQTCAEKYLWNLGLCDTLSTMKRSKISLEMVFSTPQETLISTQQ